MVDGGDLAVCVCFAEVFIVSLGLSVFIIFFMCATVKQISKVESKRHNTKAVFCRKLFVH